MNFQFSKRLILFSPLMVIAVSGVFFTSPVSARGGECSTGNSAQTGGCIAYEHADFDGMRQDLGRNRIYNYVGDKMNDNISSFRVSAGCRVIAWEHRDRGGASKVFGECSYIGDDWNDSISSWQCQCGKPDQW